MPSFKSASSNGNLGRLEVISPVGREAMSAIDLQRTIIQTTDKVGQLNRSSGVQLAPSRFSRVRLLNNSISLFLQEG